MGDVLAPRGRGRAVSARLCRRRARRATGGIGHDIVARTALDRCAGDFARRMRPSSISRAAPWQFAVASGILGWILDAYFFFILIFLLDTLAARFSVSKAAIVWSITV